MAQQVETPPNHAATQHSRDARLRVGVIAGDPLRMLGFQAVFEGHTVIAIVPVADDAPLDSLDVDLMVIAAQNSSQVFEAIGDVRAARPLMRLIVMAVPDDQEFIERVLRVGAHGYLTAVAELPEMEDAIAHVYDGDTWAPVAAGHSLMQASATATASAIPGPEAYTERELQVLQLLNTGQSNREIAVTLRIEERTVKSHVARLLKKMGVKNRTALTMQAIVHRLVGNDS